MTYPRRARPSASVSPVHMGIPLIVRAVSVPQFAYPEELYYQDFDCCAELPPESSACAQRLDTPSDILTGPETAMLLAFLPARYGASDARLLFRASRDGYNLNTLRKRAGDHFPLVVLLKTTRGVVGCFVSTSLADAASDTFFGDGESFIFSLRPEPARCEATTKDAFFLLLEKGRKVRLSLGLSGNWLCY
eukprot:m51a1_g12040 hypothetical protein (191) ;mRNA; r:2196-3369